MTDIARFKLKDNTGVFRDINAIYSPDRTVSKYALISEGDSPALFESHWWTKHDNTEASIYLSTHSGCPVGCAMCGTNKTWIRAATAEEMITQFELSYRDIQGDLSRYQYRICKWMYMGEPLLNVYEVDKAMRYIVKKYPDWIMLVSTIAPQTDWDVVEGWFRDFGDNIWFAFSIHKLDERQRNRLIPFGNKLSIDEIVEMGARLSKHISHRIGLSFNLMNKEGDIELAKKLRDKFPPSHWMPCIQFMYSKSGAEDPKHERECNMLVDDFLQKLRGVGYEEVLGLYGPESSGDWHLQTGCGQFVEFQKYIKENGIECFV